MQDTETIESDTRAHFTKLQEFLNNNSILGDFLEKFTISDKNYCFQKTLFFIFKTSIFQKKSSIIATFSNIFGKICDFGQNYGILKITMFKKNHFHVFSCNSTCFIYLFQKFSCIFFKCLPFQLFKIFKNFNFFIGTTKNFKLFVESMLSLC